MQTLVYTSIQNSKRLKEKSWKNASYVHKATLLHACNKYILFFYILSSLSCAVRNTFSISSILLNKSHICTDALCTSLRLRNAYLALCLINTERGNLGKRKPVLEK